MDQDVSHNRVEMYGCHATVSVGNQGWRLDAATGHIVSLQNALCMAVMSVA